FHPRIRQVEPLLQKINPQHRFQFFRSPPVARLGIVRLDQRAQLRPRHHLLHFFQKGRPPRLLRVPLESRHHRQCPLFARRFHLAPLYLYSLWKDRTYSESPKNPVTRTKRRLIELLLSGRFTAEQLYDRIIERQKPVVTGCRKISA